MFGWELPPYNSGGLGTACEGLTKALSLDVNIDFVMPKNFASPGQYDWMNVIDASQWGRTGRRDKNCLDLVELQKCILLNGYFTPGNKNKKYFGICADCMKDFDCTPYSHVNFYTAQAKSIALDRDFDIIHAHDWFTYLGAIEAKKSSLEKGENAPLVVHVHATQIDRAGGGVDKDDVIYKIEKAGFESADLVVAVSDYTKSIVVKHYGIDPKKIKVVHNGIEGRKPKKHKCHPIKKNYKIVLFFGRITLQKGPDYYLKIAKKVTDEYPKAKFLMVGSGDMESQMMEAAADMGLTGKLLFNTFLRNDDIDRIYQASNVFVLPSVSEPFGITPLEAMQNDVPVVISKNSGVSEVLKSAACVDFWDVDRASEEIIKLLEDEKYAREVARNLKTEAKRLTWRSSAKKLKKVYQEALKSKKDKIYA